MSFFSGVIQSDRLSPSPQRPEAPQHPGVHAQRPRPRQSHDLRLRPVQEAGGGPPQLQQRVRRAGHRGLDCAGGAERGLQGQSGESQVACPL